MVKWICSCSPCPPVAIYYQVFRTYEIQYAWW